MENFIDIAAIAVVAIVGFVVWWFVIRRTARTTGAEARRQAKRRLEEAEREAEAKVREAELAAKEKLLQARGEFEKVSRQHRSELEKLERRLAQKEDQLEKRIDELAEREKDVPGSRDRANRETARGHGERARRAGRQGESQARADLRVDGAAGDRRAQAGHGG